VLFRSERQAAGSLPKSNWRMCSRWGTSAVSSAEGRARRSQRWMPGPYAVRTTPAIQRWLLLAQPSAELTAEVPHLEHIRQLLLGSEPAAWRSIYAKVAGAVPLLELRKGDQPVVAILRGELQVSERGRISFNVSTTERAQVWVDGDAFDDRRQFEIALDRGLHQVIVRVEISGREAPELKVELGRPQDSTVQFEVIGGP